MQLFILLLKNQKGDTMAEQDDIINNLQQAKTKLNAEETATAFEGVKTLYSSKEFENPTSWPHHKEDFTNIVNTLGELLTTIRETKALVDAAAASANKLVIKKPDDIALSQLRNRLKFVQGNLHNLGARSDEKDYFQGIINRMDARDWTTEDTYKRRDWLQVLQNDADDVRKVDKNIGEAIATAGDIS